MSLLLSREWTPTRLFRKVFEIKRLDSIRVAIEACIPQFRLKKEDKQISELTQSLMTTLEGKAASEDKVLQSENDRLKEEIARLRAQLEIKTAECQQKDAIVASEKRDIADLTKTVF
ncbi:hypothetical protein G6514_007944 [Epicoccum nigrum]|nr:hypothetical protein G6514_007944 [Epicoccum nigrum]